MNYTCRINRTGRSLIARFAAVALLLDAALLIGAGPGHAQGADVESQLETFARNIQSGYCEDVNGGLAGNLGRLIGRPITVVIAGFDLRQGTIDEVNAARIQTDIEQALARRLSVSTLKDWQRILEVQFDAGGQPALKALSNDINKINGDFILFAYVESRLSPGFVEVVVAVTTPRNTCKQVVRLKIALVESLRTPEHVLRQCVASLVSSHGRTAQLRYRLQILADGAPMQKRNRDYFQNMFSKLLRDEWSRFQNLAVSVSNPAEYERPPSVDEPSLYRVTLETTSSGKGVRLSCTIAAPDSALLAQEMALIDISGVPDAKALTVAQAIWLTSPEHVLKPGMPLAFKATIRQGRWLYCALESASETSKRVFFLFPASRAGWGPRAFSSKDGELTLPKEFGFPDDAFKVEGAGRETLRCFALANRPAAAVDKEWLVRSWSAREDMARAKGKTSDADIDQELAVSVDEAQTVYVRFRALQAEEFEASVDTRK